MILIEKYRKLYSRRKNVLYGKFIAVKKDKIKIMYEKPFSFFNFRFSAKIFQKKKQFCSGRFKEMLQCLWNVSGKNVRFVALDCFRIKTLVFVIFIYYQSVILQLF